MNFLNMFIIENKLGPFFMLEVKKPSSQIILLIRGDLSQSEEYIQSKRYKAKRVWRPMNLENYGSCAVNALGENNDCVLWNQDYMNGKLI